jgi:hypothetical protein
MRRQSPAEHAALRAAEPGAAPGRAPSGTASGAGAHMAMSAATTSAYRPSQARDSTHAAALSSAAVPP